MVQVRREIRAVWGRDTRGVFRRLVGFTIGGGSREKS